MKNYKKELLVKDGDKIVATIPYTDIDMLLKTINIKYYIHEGFDLVLSNGYHEQSIDISAFRCNQI
jgi:hypothetical protein